SAWGSASSVNCPTADNGPRTIRAKVHDKDDAVREYTAQVAIANVAPTATFAANPAQIDAGGSFQLALSGASDPSSRDTAVGFAYAFDCGGGFGTPVASAATSCTAGSTAGTLTVRGRVLDKDGGYTEYAALVTVRAPQRSYAAVVQQPINTD